MSSLSRCFPPQDGSLQCPSCKTIYGEKTGTQPKGKMEIYNISQSLPGHPECHTIQIIYSIPPGIQVRQQQLPHGEVGNITGRFTDKSKSNCFPPAGSRTPEPRTAVHLQRLPSFLFPPRQRQRQEGEGLTLLQTRRIVEMFKTTCRLRHTSTVVSDGITTRAS